MPSVLRRLGTDSAIRNLCFIINATPALARPTGSKIARSQPDLQEGTVGEWVIDQPTRHAQHIRAMHLLDPETLQRTKVIDVT
jgi:hypothetical protein